MMRGGAWLTFSIFLSLTAVLGGVSAAGAAGGISLDATGRTDIELILDEATPEAIGVVAEVHGLGWEITESERGFFARLGLGEHGSAGDEGHPGLPAARRLLEIPWGAGVTVEVVAESHRDATLDELGMTHPPYPVQPPRRKDRRAGEYPFVYDEGAYGAASWTPDVIARVGRVGRMRGRELALLEIFPVAYLPSREMVRIYTRIEVRVHLEGGSPGTTEAEAERVRSFAFDRRFRHLLLNDGAYTGGERGFPPLPLGLLIITAPAYEAELAPLVSWKTKKGFDVAVVTTDVAGTTTGEIADYIAEAYNTWPIPPTYVLLVGDTDVIPTFTGLASGTEADLYYVTVSEGDYFPEMGLGRFPVRSTAQVATLVEKGVDLERLEISSGYAWLNKICFIAASDLGGFAENTHEYVIEQYVDPAGLSYDKIWERLGGSTQDIANSVNGGVTIVEYSGHGYEYGWSSVPFNQSDVRNLVNYDMYPFVISNACLTGSFGVSECYGETWPIVDGKGGISHWGASNYSYWDEDDILEKRMFRALFQENFSSVSGFTDRALEELWVYYGGAGRSQYYFDAYNVMGDPSLEIWAGTPDDMTASYPPALPMGVNEIEVWASSARDAVDSALCCVSDGSSVLGVAYTDLSGYAAVPLDPPLEDPGAYLLTVTRSGYVPHEGSFEIIASDGP